MTRERRNEAGKRRLQRDASHKGLNSGETPSTLVFQANHHLVTSLPTSCTEQLEHVPEQYLWETTAKQGSLHIHTPPDIGNRSKKYTLLQIQKENKYACHFSEMEYLKAAL